MIIQMLKTRLARCLVYVLCTLLVLGGEPLLAVQQNVEIVPRQDQPEWLEPWLESGTYAHAWNSTAGWVGGTSTELQDRLGTWWDGAWEPAWEYLEAGLAVPTGPKRLAIVQSDSPTVPALSAAVGSAGSSDSLAKPQVPGFEKEHSRSDDATDHAGAIPLQRVERKAKRQEGRASDLGLKTAGPAQPSIPRQAISKAGLAPEIVALAASLNNSPGRIFRYVHDEVDFEPLWGAGKPPLGTLQEGAGTPWDKAWLLRDLLTAAGVDARFEWGEIEISGEQLVNITGVDDPFRAGDLLSTAGVPIVLIVSGSQVVAARMSHVWIKAYLDYVPNRGATPGPGDTWVAMDPSLERFEISGGTRLDEEVLFGLGDYLPSGSLQAPRDVYEDALQAYAASHGLGIYSVDELKPPKTLLQEAFPYVPGTLRGKILSVAGESVEMPASFEQQVQLQVRKATGEVLLSWSTSWPAVYGQRLELAWPGASSSDQATLDLYGGVFSTPPYEVDLRPVLRVDGAEVASGSPIGSAEDVELVATLTPPQGTLTVAQFELYAGEHAVFAVDFGRTPQQVVDRYTAAQTDASDAEEAEGWGLARAAAVYLRGLAGDLDHLAALRFQRVVKLGNIVLAVQRGGVSSAADGTPLTFSIAPPSIDLGAMTLGLFAADGVQSTSTASVSTLELLGSQASAREAESLTTALGGAHVSAVTFLTRAAREGQQLTLVDAANVDDALEAAELSTDAEAAVRAGVSQGLVAWIPESQLVVDTWDATGYILEQPATGAAGYFVTYERVAPSLEGAITFHSPQDLDVITQPTDVIASIDVPDLANWTLSTRPTGQTNSKVIATGTGPVDNTLLGQFDPTLLLNGMHDLVLTGSDAAGQTISSRITVVVEGNMKIGHFTLSFVDLAIPLSGLDIEIVRTYDSRQKDELLDFGYGWSLDIRQGSYQNNRPPGDGWQIVNPGGPFGLPCSQTVESKSHLTTVRLSDQEVYRFRLALVDAATVIGGCYARAEFQWVDGPLPGTTLEILGNDEVIYQGESNSDFVIDSDTFETFVPDEVKLTTRDGRIFHLNLSTGVTHLEDLNGNAVDISVAGITHSSGVGIDFVRNPEGRIQEIVDLRGNSNLYSYSAAGDFVRHTDRAGGETQFAYREHYLEDIHNALGARAVRNEYDADGRLVRVIDAEGHLVEFQHDLDARREVMTDRIGRSTILEYDARGSVIRETDSLGHVTTRTYDDRDRVLTESDPLGNRTTQVYSTAGDLISRTDSLGNTQTFSYDSHSRRLSETDPLGNTTTYEYDANGNHVATRDPLGNGSTIAYDGTGNRTAITDALGATTTFSYDGAGNVVQMVDAPGLTTSYTYDAAGNRLTEQRTRSTPEGTVTLETRFTYDELGRMAETRRPDGSVVQNRFTLLGQVSETVDSVGNVTRFEYDSRGRQVSTTLPDDSSSSTEYDDAGQPVSTTSRGGAVSRYEYDGAGRMVRSVFADGSESTRAYDAAGRLLSTTDPLGNVTQFEYDALGRQTKMTDALGNSTQFSFDAAGLQTSITDSLGHTTTFEYDVAGRRVGTRFHDGTSVATAYDAAGRRIAETDAAGDTTSFKYDEVGRLTEVTDALGGKTTHAYDESGNRVSQTDARGNTTLFEYDLAGREIRRTFADGSSESRGYDIAGNLTHVTNPLGQMATYRWNALGQLLERSYSDGSDASFTYTSGGQRATATDSRGTATYAYDDAGRLMEHNYPDGTKIGYSWDAAGNKTSTSLDLGDQVLTTRYTYDALNRLATVVDDTGGVYEFGYDAAGNRSSLSYPNGVSTGYVYNDLNRLVDLTSETATGNVVQSHVYTLGPMGNRQGVVEHDGTTRSYVHDALYRLTEETVSDGTGEWLSTATFGYDPVGNRITETRQAADETPHSSDYVYDERDRLVSKGGESWTWDSWGRLLRKGSEATYDWSFEDPLSSTTLADGTTIEHSYSADGFRVETQVSGAGGSVSTTQFMVDDTGVLSHVLADLDETGQLVAYYVVAGDEVLAIHRPSVGARYYHQDGLGSVRVLTDESGSVTDRYTYDAFGVLTHHEGDDPQAYLFAGQRFDANLGFYHLRARWMDPEVGRFASMDSYSGSTFEPRTLHRYTYASNDPVNLVDPSGLFSSVNSAVVAAAIVGITAAIGAGFVAFQSGRYLPENPFIGVRATHAIFGGSLSFTSAIVARANPWLLIALAPLAGFIAGELLVGLDPPYDLLWYFAFGVSYTASLADLTKRGKVEGSVYAGLAYNVEFPADYTRQFYCFGGAAVPASVGAGLGATVCSSPPKSRDGSPGAYSWTVSAPEGVTGFRSAFAWYVGGWKLGTGQAIAKELDGSAASVKRFANEALNSLTNPDCWIHGNCGPAYP